MQAGVVADKVTLLASNSSRVSHGTALELRGMIATMNYLPGYGSELVHVSVCRQRDLRKIQGMKFHYARHGVDVAHADELVSSVSAMQAVCQIAP